MKHSERFALNEWLSDYPQEMSFDDVIDLVIDEDLAVTPCQWFENIPRYELAENIDNTRSHFECVVNNMSKDLGQLKEGE
jgi:DNA-binding IscR family transcriptional regulator